MTRAPRGSPTARPITVDRLGDDEEVSGRAVALEPFDGTEVVVALVVVSACTEEAVLVKDAEDTVTEAEATPRSAIYGGPGEMVKFLSQQPPKPSSQHHSWVYDEHAMILVYASGFTALSLA